jgi:cell division GTPase FtsZ
MTLLVGVGGAGCRLADFCGDQLGLPSLAINSDARALADSSASRKLLIQPAGGLPTTHMKMRAAAQAVAVACARELTQFDQVMFLAGLGRKTGTNALPPIVGALQQAGCRIGVAVTTPFSYETTRSHAELGLSALRDLRCDLRVYDLQELEEKMPNARMIDVLAAAAETIKSHVEAWLTREPAV